MAELLSIVSDTGQAVARPSTSITFSKAEDLYVVEVCCRTDDSSAHQNGRQLLPETLLRSLSEHIGGSLSLPTVDNTAATLRFPVHRREV
ncbi:MAG: hypothetical protein HC888_10045 [Candidatus Competibacteraceae bacterium]|nr:hypothetical protein [Candidatus Competibacteraceae bacterium]